MGTVHGMRSLPCDRLVVSTQRRWIVDDLRAGAAGRCDVVHDWGLDLPDVRPRTSWWVPAGHAARLLAAGLDLEFVAPGPGWLCTVDAALTRRTVTLCSLGDLDASVGPGFVKLAEAKIDGADARWEADVADFAGRARQAGVPDDAAVEVSDRRLDLVEEHRCYVLGRRVVTTSPYLRHADGSTWEPGWESSALFDHDGARAFAAEVVADPTVTQPHAFVVDVGLCADGAWAVIEANPAWCCGTYGAELTSVVDVVASSTTAGSDHARWRWVPDPSLVVAAARQPTLSRRGTVAERVGTAGD